MVEEKDELIDSKLSIHDKHRFEVKLDIALKKDVESVSKIEYFFFIPQGLNLSPQTFNKDVFYSDTQHYIRFKTPNIALEKLFYPGNELSPYNRIIKGLDSINSGISDEFLVETIIDEIKLLGCIIRVEVRDLSNFFSKGVRCEAKPLSKGSPIYEPLVKFRSDLKMTADSMNSLKTRMLTSQVNPRIRESFLLLDEYVSLMMEEYVTALVKDFKASGKCSPELVSDFGKMAVEQRKYRKAMGYKSALPENACDEYFMYHRGVLKKFISSALYLKPEMSEFNVFFHLGPAIAAGLAMLFAILVTVYAQSRFAINSITFIFIIVISYIFKDRIKDWLKIIFSRKMVNWLFDRKINVTEPAHNSKLGYIKETFFHVPQILVPHDIMRRRNADNTKNIEEDMKRELVFKYKKEIRLDPAAIKKYHQRRKDLIDIMRFSVFDFIKQADDELAGYRIVDEAGEVKEMKCVRLYHLNLIVKYYMPDEEIRYERIRILLGKNGLYKVEDVDSA